MTDLIVKRESHFLESHTRSKPIFCLTNSLTIMHKKAKRLHKKYQNTNLVINERSYHVIRIGITP
jgi:hypothetical protein